MPKTIRYRYAMLLAWAALATNPVWHVASHLLSEHLSDEIAHVSDTQWTEQDLCPSCDATAPLAEAAITANPIADVVWQGDVVLIASTYAELQPHFYTRLRAPPVLA